MAADDRPWLMRERTLPWSLESILHDKNFLTVDFVSRALWVGMSGELEEWFLEDTLLEEPIVESRQAAESLLAKSFIPGLHPDGPNRLLRFFGRAPGCDCYVGATIVTGLGPISFLPYSFEGIRGRLVLREAFVDGVLFRRRIDTSVRPSTLGRLKVQVLGRGGDSWSRERQLKAE